jgi:hypothetical protein
MHQVYSNNKTITTFASCMADLKNCTFREGSDKAAISAIHLSYSLETAIPVIHLNNLSDFILNTITITFLEGTPSCFGQIVAANI